jgi:hypothetical protein
MINFMSNKIICFSLSKKGSHILKTFSLFIFRYKLYRKGPTSAKFQNLHFLFFIWIDCMDNFLKFSKK